MKVIKEKLEVAVEEFIDTYCALYGAVPCINLLRENCGFTKEDLLEFGFGEEQIIEALISR